SESVHSFDVTKHGYVTLSSDAGLKHDGDDADMLPARETSLSKGHFAPFVEAVTGAIQNAFDTAISQEDVPEPTLLEVGAGTGYYLSHTLDSIDGARGVGLDISPHAARH